jgi:hypothetical protein
MNQKHASRCDRCNRWLFKEFALLVPLRMIQFTQLEKSITRVLMINSARVNPEIVK